MSRFNLLVWPEPPAIWSYGIAVLSIGAGLIVSQSHMLHLRDAPVSLFLCAVLSSAWLGGIGPALVTTAFSAGGARFHLTLPTKAEAHE